MRYPGGKACLSSFLTDILDLNELRHAAYFEPYAGGAGAALTLLLNGVVSEININDADPRIFSFRDSILAETDRLPRADCRNSLEHCAVAGGASDLRKTSGAYRIRDRLRGFLHESVQPSWHLHFDYENPRLIEFLVVDDEPVSRKVLESYLAADGHRVVTATNAGEAITCGEAGPFDLLLTDHAMPGLNGVQLAAVFREMRPDIR